MRFRPSASVVAAFGPLTLPLSGVVLFVFAFRQFSAGLYSPWLLLCMCLTLQPGHFPLPRVVVWALPSSSSPSFLHLWQVFPLVFFCVPCALCSGSFPLVFLSSDPRFAGLCCIPIPTRRLVLLRGAWCPGCGFPLSGCYLVSASRGLSLFPFFVVPASSPTVRWSRFGSWPHYLYALAVHSVVSVGLLYVHFGVALHVMF